MAAAATTIAGLSSDVPYWWMAVLIVSVMSVAFALLGRQLRLEFRDQEQDLMVTLARAGAIVHHTDLARSVVNHVNGDIEELTGWTASEWTTLDHRSIIHPDDLDAYWIDAEDARDGMVLDRTWRVRRPDGSSVWLRDVSRVSEGRKGNKSMRGFTLDVTALEQANRCSCPARHADRPPQPTRPQRAAR